MSKWQHPDLVTDEFDFFLKKNLEHVTSRWIMKRFTKISQLSFLRILWKGLNTGSCTLGQVIWTFNIVRGKVQASLSNQLSQIRIPGGRTPRCNIIYSVFYCQEWWCSVFSPVGHSVIDRASVCGAGSPGFDFCNIQMIFLLWGISWKGRNGATHVKIKGSSFSK